MPRKTLNPEIGSETPQPKVEEPSNPIGNANLKKIIDQWRAGGVQVRHFDMGKSPMSDAEQQFRYLIREPSVPFYIPLGWGEKDGAKQWVQRNELAMWIDKGRMVNLPKPIADQLMESLKMTEIAQRPFAILKNGQVVRTTESAEPFSSHGE